MTKYIILWGNGDWEEHKGTLESAIKRAKDAYWNYGHKSATIVPFEPLYHVKDEMKETTKFEVSADDRQGEALC